MVPLSMTLTDLWPGFQGHNIFGHWGTIYCCKTSIGRHRQSIKWYHLWRPSV